MTTSEALPLEADPLAGTDAGEERLTRKDRAALRPAWRQPLALIGISIILAWIIIAIFAPELAPYPPNLQFAPLMWLPTTSTCSGPTSWAATCSAGSCTAPASRSLWPSCSWPWP